MNHMEMMGYRNNKSGSHCIIKGYIIKSKLKPNKFVPDLTCANKAFAMTSNIEEKTRTLILACNSAESPLNNSKTFAFA